MGIFLLLLLLERSFQAQFLVPMAVSLCFGLMVATVLTLLYVPALYLINKDIIRLFSAKEGRADIGDQTTANG
jgi:multidrug efflux pump subunit AcrB